MMERDPGLGHQDWLKTKMAFLTVDFLRRLALVVIAHSVMVGGVASALSSHLLSGLSCGSV